MGFIPNGSLSGECIASSYAQFWITASAHIKTLAPKATGCHLTVIILGFLRVPWDLPQARFSLTLGATSGFGTLQGMAHQAHWF